MLETWLRKSRVRLPTIVVLETWLRESRVRLPTTVMLEAWLWESMVPPKELFLIS